MAAELRSARCRAVLVEIAKLADRAAKEPLTDDLALVRLRSIEAMARDAQVPQGLFEELWDQTRNMR